MSERYFKCVLDIYSTIQNTSSEAHALKMYLKINGRRCNLSVFVLACVPDSRGESAVTWQPASLPGCSSVLGRWSDLFKGQLEKTWSEAAT